MSYFNGIFICFSVNRLFGRSLSVKDRSKGGSKRGEERKALFVPVVQLIWGQPETATEIKCVSATATARHPRPPPPPPNSIFLLEFKLKGGGDEEGGGKKREERC